MKRCPLNILLSLVLLMLTACQKAEDAEQQDVAAVRMIAAGKPFPGNATRVSGATDVQLQNTLLLPGQQIGVYIFNANTPTSGEYNDGLPIAHNVMQTGKLLRPEGYADGVYPLYPNEGLSAVNVYAFYPYSLVSGLPRSGTVVPVSAQADQTTVANYIASDFMASDPVINHHPGDSEDGVIYLLFNHLMSKVTVTLRKAGSIMEDLSGFTLYFCNSKRVGSLSLDTRAVTVDDTASPSDITMMTLTSDLSGSDTRQASILAVPQVMGSGTFLVLTNGEKTYSASLPLKDATWTYVDTTTWTDPNGDTGLTLEPGYEYHMTATVTDTALQIDAVIRDFQTGGIYSGELIEDPVPIGQSATVSGQRSAYE